MTTIIATIHIDEAAQRAVIECLHPGQPFTIEQVTALLVRMAIEKLAEEEEKNDE